MSLCHFYVRDAKNTQQPYKRGPAHCLQAAKLSIVASDNFFNHTTFYITFKATFFLTLNEAVGTFISENLLKSDFA